MPDRPPSEYPRGYSSNPLKRFWRFLTKPRLRRETDLEAFIITLEIILSAKIDALTATVVSLEATAANSASATNAAIQLFKDNAAASIELAADDLAVADLTSRIAAAQKTIDADSAALADASKPAPVADPAPVAPAAGPAAAPAA